jgi:thioredoxin reductase
MSDAIVVDDGNAGLSAALSTAKNGLSARVFDTDSTWIHEAHLYNYLGVGSVDGDAFLETARA